MSINEEHDPVANLHMQPAKGILKSTKSTDDPKQDNPIISTHTTTTSGMTRSESKSHKIPHFDEMNIIATYHPADKDYGHMKIEEPKTPYAPNDIIEEESTTSGIDPTALAQRLQETDVPAPTTHQISRRSIDEDSDGTAPTDIEHRKEFESHRKKHYNEFEVVRLRRKEIEDELRALEQEESTNESDGKGSERMSSSRSSVDSIKPILVHSRDSSTSSGHHHHHHVQVVDSDDSEQQQRALTPEEQERKKQFELKRKKHYNEFRAARLADKQDDDPSITG